jgi:hypothetical protein
MPEAHSVLRERRSLPREPTDGGGPRLDTASPPRIWGKRGLPQTKSAVHPCLYLCPRDYPRSWLG